MSKLNFKDYSANYDELKAEEKKNYRQLKKQERKEDKKYKYQYNDGIMQDCLELKEYLEVLKSSVNFIDKKEMRSNISKNLKNIQVLKRDLLTAILKLIFWTVSIWSLLPWSIIMLICEDVFIYKEYVTYIGKLIKIIIGSLPFKNRYSFVKTIRKLEKLEKEYKNFSKQYEDYLKYLDSPEKSEVTENIIKGKEVKDLYLLEITKLADKVRC